MKDSDSEDRPPLKYTGKRIVGGMRSGRAFPASKQVTNQALTHRGVGDAEAAIGDVLANGVAAEAPFRTEVRDQGFPIETE